MKRFEWDMVGMLAFDDGTWVLHESAERELAAKDQLIEAMIAHVDARAIEWSALSSAKALWMAHTAEDIASQLRAMVEAAKL